MWWRMWGHGAVELLVHGWLVIVCVSKKPLKKVNSVVRRYDIVAARSATKRRALEKY
jgi:hypothetical protein